jgi:chromosome segregation ATPase
VTQETRPETAVGPIGWLQDQVYELKGHVAQLEQQLEHLRATASDMSDNSRALQLSLQEAAREAAQVPRLQEEINQAAALILQLQDDQASTREQVDVVTRRRHDDDSRDQEEWTELARRVDVVERQVELWHDRQAAVDEVGRHFQEAVSQVNIQLGQIERRLEAVESKAARGLEGATRAEHTLTQVEAAILALQREDAAIAERAKVAGDVAHRLEGTINQSLQELQRLELLADRIDLHRAERQRLEERAVHIEEGLNAVREREEHREHQEGLLRTHQNTLGSRVDALVQQLEQEKALLTEQMRKLISSQERTKRRQIQELEREVREMRKHVVTLSEE